MVSILCFIEKALLHKCGIVKEYNFFFIPTGIKKEKVFYSLLLETIEKIKKKKEKKYIWRKLRYTRMCMHAHTIMHTQALSLNACLVCEVVACYTQVPKSVFNSGESQNFTRWFLWQTGFLYFVTLMIHTHFFSYLVINHRKLYLAKLSCLKKSHSNFGYSFLFHGLLVFWINIRHNKHILEKIFCFKKYSQKKSTISKFDAIFTLWVS